MINAQTNPLCIEKSSRNSYSAIGDTSLFLYKTVAQTSDTRLLLFKSRWNTTPFEIPVIARAGVEGNIEWARKIICPAGYNITQLDAIVLRNNRSFVYAIAQPVANNREWMAVMIWLDENGNIPDQKTYRADNASVQGISLPIPNSLKINETTAGELLILSAHTVLNTNKNLALLIKTDAWGNIAWHRSYSGVSHVYNPIGIVSYNNTVILQGTSSRQGYPSSTILNTTKLSLETGDIIGGKSYVEPSDVGTAGTGNIILTENYTLKTSAYWRIPFYYQISFSFTMDTSLSLLRSTTFHTTSSAESYLYGSGALNSRGMSLFKTKAPAPFNTGYFIAGMDDNILQQKTIANNPPFEEYLQGSNCDVAFDNADSVYLYWNGIKNGKRIVGWIKTGVHNTADFCSVKDSSFIMIDPYPMSPINWELGVLPANTIDAFVFPVQTPTALITRELVCETVTAFCDPIRIRPVDPVCSLTGPVKLTVGKNPECRGRILFNFDPAAIVSWQQPDDTTLLLQFDKSWQGKIYASPAFCPLVKDSITLVVSAPLPGISIGNDTILCKGNSFTLSPGDGFDTYTWQDGSNTSSFTVREGGTFWVTVKDQCNRVYSDTIRVTFIDAKPNLGTDRSICKKEVTELTAKGDFISYTWSPAYHISSLSEKRVIVHPETTTLYQVEAWTREGCIGKDTVIIHVKDCPQTFYIPSAFTPNNDGKNDLFGPIIGAPVEQYVFSIYNRWGQLVFYSTDKNKGWDGKLQGTAQDNGVFVWTCSFKFYDRPAEFKKGAFTLIK